VKSRGLFQCTACRRQTSPILPRGSNTQVSNYELYASFAGGEMQGGRDKGSTTNSLVKMGNRKNYLVPYNARSG
jgi:hypothetical protein